MSEEGLDVVQEGLNAQTTELNEIELDQASGGADPNRMKQCPECGQFYSRTLLTCPYCGQLKSTPHYFR